MAIKDILLGLRSYPEPTQISTIEQAVLIAAVLDSHIAAMACEIHLEIPSSLIAPPLLNVPALIASEAQTSRTNVEKLLTAFEAAAAKQGVMFEAVRERCMAGEAPDILAEYARLRDLTIMPVPESHEQWYCEAVIFGSGRPTLVLPEGAPSKSFQLNTAVVAWDFSRAAARAVADAIPLLERAKHVRIVTVLGEKVIDSKRSTEELAKNLSRHGLEVELDKVDSEGRTIGETLEAYAKSSAADILVMGAYGHSRFREFVLGGATRSLLAKPPLPILFSH
jgi:nucleotide-binding universal stress UspA family protein